jgi:hypothetical protein
MALTAIGFTASSQDTGGGVCCVVMERADGGEITWGTADFNWGASVANSDGRIESSLETKCPSDSQDIAVIVEAIRGPSISARAAMTDRV